MTRTERIRVLGLIAQDMEDDATRSEGMAFTGKNVAEALGQLGAAVQAVAKILAQELEEQTTQQETKQ